MQNQDQGSDTPKKENSIPLWVWPAVAAGVTVLSVFAWLVFFSGGSSSQLAQEDLEQEQQEQETEGQQDLSQEEAVLEQAKTRLEALEERMQSEEVSEEMIEEIRDIRADLAAAYAEAHRETKAIWQELDKGLRAFEETLRGRVQET